MKTKIVSLITWAIMLIATFGCGEDQAPNNYYQSPEPGQLGAPGQNGVPGAPGSSSSSSSSTVVVVTPSPTPVVSPAPSPSPAPGNSEEHRSDDKSQRCKKNADKKAKCQ